MSRPDGQAPADAAEAYWFKCDMDAWALVRDLLPRPWPAALCMEDLKHLAARERYRRAAWDGQTALQARWGVSASTVKRYLAAARAKAGPALDQPWTSGEPSEPHQQPIADDARTSHGPALDQPWTSGEPTASENAQQVALLEAPKRESETETENTSKPAKAGAVDLQALLDEMHAMELSVRPTAQAPRLSTYEKSIRRTLEGLKDRAREEASTPRALMMAAWTWWWTNPEGWHRTALHGARGYRAFFQHAHVRHYLDRMRDEAATAPASPAAAPPKPKTPGEVAWDRWMEGLDVARAWYAANKGTREGDAFHAAMEAACKPNPIAELFGGYMDNPKEKRLVREVFVSEYERRTAPLRLVAR